MSNDSIVPRKVVSVSELKPGMVVRISDGTKMPPKHHRRKLQAWEHRNQDGWVHDVQPDLGTFGITKSNPLERARVRVVCNNHFNRLAAVEILSEAE